MRRANSLLFLGAYLSLLISSAGHASLFDKKLMINGAGATFPYPLYSKWFSEYQKLHPELAFNYQSIGSGGGIRQLLDQTVDFGASDSPMSDEQLKKAKSPIIHIPATMGAVVLSYNFPSFTAPLKLTGPLIAEIFLGKIKKWDDPNIVALNPSLKDLRSDGINNDILVVHRADGSGTTAIFSDFLSKSSEEWKTKVGKGTALRWPVGIGGKGNEGVTSFVQQIPGSIGYVELVFAKTLHLKTAEVENAVHEFVEPTPESVTAAAMGALASIPADFRYSLTLVKAPHAYPISSFTYILVYPGMPASAKRDALFQFINWGLTRGQALSAKLNYAPLPESLVKRVLEKVNQP
ncbi:MAG: phosphate ABC transporter substrate-binding protein PstS [Bdellovibrionales bacterium]|nr:phosphate ABC transporter substrate-binding protein PstS [Oligoflexia bacterium]